MAEDAESSRGAARKYASGHRAKFGLALFVMAVAAGAALARRRGYRMITITALLELLEEAGWAGYCVLLVAFSLWVACSLPTTPIEVACGFLYGLSAGTFCGLFCKTLGSVIAFLLVRALKDSRGWDVPDALASQLEPLRAAPTLTMIGIRIAPLPLGVKNYGLALCDVPLVPYIVAALLVNAPFSFLWATAGSSATSLKDALNLDGDKPPSPVQQFLKKGVPAILALVMLIMMIRRLRFSSGMLANNAEAEVKRGETIATLGVTAERTRRASRRASTMITEGSRRVTRRLTKSFSFVDKDA